jgi:three-Cys-motif partner protein
MPQKDLHSTPFDEATLTKLSLFEKYAEVWIPKFVMTPGIQEIHIFDFFAGPGYDINRVPGSPIRILNRIKEQKENFKKTNTRIIFHLNEFTKGKFDLLKKNCEDFVNENNELNSFLKLKYYCEDSAELFPRLLDTIKKFPSLVYLDQNGVKFISKEYLNELEKIKTTDFLFFVSSSYFKWLGRTPEFQNVLQFTDLELEEMEWSNSHRLVVEKLQSSISSESYLKLYPFSIKKKRNIFGLIFGASHPAAVSGFLKLCWDENSLNGEANFDIDEDKDKGQIDLFSGKKLTKVEKFEIDLADRIISGEIGNNKDALDYTFATGNDARKAQKLIQRLKREGKIEYTGNSPGVNYSNVYKKKNLIKFRIL